MDAIGIVRRAMRLADGEGVWSWHPWAGAKFARDGDIGPDGPTRRDLAGDGD
jgi:hypothetical protein